MKFIKAIINLKLNIFKIKLLVVVVFCITCAACTNPEEHNILYNQLLNYRNDLKINVNNQDGYLFVRSCDNNFFKNRYDSLNKIKLELEKSFEKLRYKDKKKVLETRDNFNNKYKLDLEFTSYTDYEDINDSIFNRSIEVDYLRLINAFQTKNMFINRSEI